MTIRVIVEFPAKPGKRAEFKSLLENVAVKYGPSQPSSLGSPHFEVLDNPNILVEIADWAPAAVR